MLTKTFEVRDAGTFMPVLAIRLGSSEERDRYLMARAGFGTSSFIQRGYILIHPLCYNECSYDSFFWLKNGTRTLHVAHQFILKNFDELDTGAVIDVQYILGETETPKKSEQVEDLSVG